METERKSHQKSVKFSKRWACASADERMDLFPCDTTRFYPWFIDSEQASLLIQTLQNFAMACKYFLSGEIKVDFEGGETLLRFYSPEKEL